MAGDEGKKRKYVEGLLERYVSLNKSKYVKGKYWIGSNYIPDDLCNKLIEAYKKDSVEQKEKRKQQRIEEFNKAFDMEDNIQQVG